MKLLDHLQTELTTLDAQSLLRRRRNTDTMCAPRTQVDGKPMLAF